MHPRKLATILAALRYWQQDLEANEDPPISDHFTDHDPLTPEEIDDLCEELNFADAAPTNTPTPPLEELRIMLNAAAYWVDAEADEDHPDPMDEVCELVRDANATFCNLFPEKGTEECTDCTDCTDDSCAWCQAEIAARS